MPTRSSRSGWPLYILALAAFGIFLPWLKRLEFLDVLVILPYACLSWVFAVPAVCSGVEQNRPIGPRQVWSAILRAFLFAWGSSMLVLGLGLATVNVRTWHGSILLPSGSVLQNSLLIGLGGSLVISALSAWLTLVWNSATKARNVLRTVLLVSLGGLYLWLDRAPLRVRFALIDLFATGSPAQVAFPFLLGSILLTGLLAVGIRRQLAYAGDRSPTSGSNSAG